MKPTKNDQSTEGTPCAHCGQPIEPTRINGQYIIDEISSVLSFKKGIFFTIRELLVRPGQSIRAFIREDRHRLVKPVLFLIFCSFIYTVLQQTLNFEDGYINFGTDVPESTTFAIVKWIQTHYGYSNIFIAVFVAFFLKLLFRKYDYNFFEILILLMFVFGTVMLISSFFGVIETLVGIRVLPIGGFLTFVYVGWAIGLFFDGKNAVNYFKGLVAYILGLFTSIIIVFIVGMLIDSIV